jgi:hypothetical protein
MKQRRCIEISAILVLMLFGCATTDHKLQIRPLQTSMPVSASSYFADSNGRVLGPKDYKIVNHFAKENTFKAPALKATQSNITTAFEEALTGLVKSNNGDAVVNLVIRAKKYDDKGVTYNTKFWQIMGSGAISLGVIFSGTAIAIDDGDISMPMGITGGVVLLGGVAAVLLSGMTPSSEDSMWTIMLEGDVVKLK